MKQYKAVAGPMNINVERGNQQKAFDLFAQLINAEAVDGWQYHSMETITITQKGGCMSQPISINHYMLIFFKEV